MEVHAQGHALFDKKGKDIVCASASVLLENWCLSEKELCRTKIEMIREKGFLKARIVDGNKEDLLLFKSLALGIMALAEQYPENIKVIVEDDNGRQQYSEKRQG